MIRATIVCFIALNTLLVHSLDVSKNFRRLNDDVEILTEIIQGSKMESGDGIFSSSDDEDSLEAISFNAETRAAFEKALKTADKTQLANMAAGLFELLVSAMAAPANFAEKTAGKDLDALFEQSKELQKDVDANLKILEPLANSKDSPTVKTNLREATAGVMQLCELNYLNGRINAMVETVKKISEKLESEHEKHPSQVNIAQRRLNEQAQEVIVTGTAALVAAKSGAIVSALGSGGSALLSYVGGAAGLQAAMTTISSTTFALAPTSAMLSQVSTVAMGAMSTLISSGTIQAIRSAAGGLIKWIANNFGVDIAKGGFALAMGSIKKLSQKWGKRHNPIEL